MHKTYQKLVFLLCHFGEKNLQVEEEEIQFNKLYDESKI